MGQVRVDVADALAPTTQAGVILGTAAYMSPERTAGKPVDKRSDVWAFGVVVMEMLTGQPVFNGETVSHVLASVLKSDPDWGALPATTPNRGFAQFSARSADWLDAAPASSAFREFGSWHPAYL